MEIILPSFGLSHITVGWYYSELSSQIAYYRMPPLLSRSGINQSLMPDYAVLLLCDRIIIDKTSWEVLYDGLQSPEYDQMADFMKALHGEGFVRIEDFAAIINTKQELLTNMLKYDLRSLDNWVKPFKQSVQIWNSYTEKHRNNRNYGSYDPIEWPFIRSVGPDLVSGWLSQQLAEALKSSQKRRLSEYRDVLTRGISEYLAYVNANLVISNTLDSGFHDWQDFSPFYQAKFLGFGKEDNVQAKSEKIKNLFTIAFPEFGSWSPKNIIKALKDKRIYELRKLVDESLKGEVIFDREFANRILMEVLAVEQSLMRTQKLVSWLTLPLDFIPGVGTPIQKVVEELTGFITEKSLRKKYSWFYLISELSQHTT